MQPQLIKEDYYVEEWGRKWKKGRKSKYCKLKERKKVGEYEKIVRQVKNFGWQM